VPWSIPQSATAQTHPEPSDRPFSSKDPTLSVDVVLALNGVPAATLELKNPLTGQTVEDAKRQYRFDRDPREPLFAFKRRALVHFAVDPDEIAMTTRLHGKDTRFLPFNRGRDGGAGNPEVAGNFRTAYLWEEVLVRDSLLELLARFIHLEVQDLSGGAKRETLIFPRYHQRDCVRRLVATAGAEGPGHDYLIQHSAGSGKTNTIAWTAHRLATLHDAQDRKIFDSVIVVTDRLVLDQQLQQQIWQFEQVQGTVERIDDDSAQLAAALQAGRPLIITTLQKFPFVVEKVGLLPARRYAVIVDEAHSSQGGEAVQQMKQVLAGVSLDEAAKRQAEEDGKTEGHEEAVIRAMLARGRQPNLCFLAFTATPKAKTLETFGRRDGAGDPQPFHLYTMRQAIEENFILDVLKHYTTYHTYFGLLKRAAEDPKLDKRKAARSLGRFMSLHPHNIAQKVEVIVEHFRIHVRSKMGGQAKAMVVTGSRLHAVRYKLELDRYIKERGYTDVRSLVAFSGTVIDEGLEWTEPGMNGFGERELPGRLAGPEYQILLVAEKYQTGFDQPLLHTMYVDKRLAGVQAVQTLSRLNRTHPGKEDTFVLDFVNDPEEIRAAFQPYYEVTTLESPTDPQLLYELQAKLHDTQVYHLSEVEAFTQAFFGVRYGASTTALKQMNAAIDPAVDRFRALEPDRQEEGKALLTSLRDLYKWLAQVIPFADADLEKLYAYVRFLLTKLPRREGGGLYDLGDEVALEYYRLQKLSEGTIELAPGGGAVIGPAAVGSRVAEPVSEYLSSIVKLLNERFGTEFTQADQLFFEQIAEQAAANEDLAQSARVNGLENFRYAFDRELEGLFIDRMDQNEAIFTRYMDDPAFKRAVSQALAKEVWNQVRAAGQTTPSAASAVPQ